MSQGHEQQVKVITVPSGGFLVIPANSSVPAVVMCEGATPVPESTNPEPPDPTAIFTPSPPHPGMYAFIEAGTLEDVNLHSLSEDVSTLVIEAKPSEYGKLTALNDLARNQTLAERGVDIEVRPRRDV